MNYGLLAGAMTALILMFIFNFSILVWCIAPGIGMLSGIIIGNIIDEDNMEDRD